MRTAVILIIVALGAALVVTHWQADRRVAGLILQREMLADQVGILKAVDIDYTLDAAQIPGYQRIRLPMHADDFVHFTSPFGKRGNILGGSKPYREHFGIDVAGLWLARIVAVKDGTVIDHWYDHPVMGRAIQIDHGDGTRSWYWHLSESYIHEGYTVKAGEVIGRQGDSGMADGAHLHFAYIIDGGYVNPARYLR